MLRRLFGGGTSSDDLWSTMSSLSAMLSKLHASGVAASPRRHSGVIFIPDDANPFLADLKANLDDVLYVGPGATKTAVEIKNDVYGMPWVILDDGNFPDLLSSTYTVVNAIRHNGGAGNLLAATFHLDFASSLLTTPAEHLSAIIETYVIFRYDRNRYYPFIPDLDAKPIRKPVATSQSGSRQDGNESDAGPGRDSATESQLAAAMRRYGLAVEADPAKWEGLWDVPF